ncbi:MAG: methyltransferase domain-containing protein [candidate division WOR-3 bacterium]
MDKIFFNYDRIANLYDSFMSMVPYKIWAENIYNVCKSFKIKGVELIDLGAGTGNLSKYLSDYGFNVTLVDISIEMLKEAQKKNYRNSSTFVCCDIVNLSIKKSFDIAICMYDTVNHISAENITGCFLNVFNILKNDAIFVFDFNTEFGLELMSKNSQIRDGNGFISFWETEYDQKSKICTLNLKIEYFNKKTESFVFSERALFPEELENDLKEVGFRSVDFYDFSTMKKLSDYSERGLVVCRK